MRILVTGVAGFIGSKLAYQLVHKGYEVVGIDNLNHYYEVNLKYKRLALIGIKKPENGFIENEKVNSKTFKNFLFLKADISKKENLFDIFEKYKFDFVINLAAQAGVRASITNPYAYMKSNYLGFLNMVEACRNYPVKHFVFASSSSVYGQSETIPFHENDACNEPVSLYAASKKADEMMAYAYSKLYGIPTTGLRFFTVYGPYGRPDMAPMLFAKSITEESAINVFNNGDMYRDFTYIDDIVKGTIKVMSHIPEASKCSKNVPYKLFNIGCGHPSSLMDFIHELELNLGKKAKMNFLPMQLGDVSRTYADTFKLKSEIGYEPQVSLKEGIKKFIEWYLSSDNPIS